jgi:hypothetical protein
MVTVRDRVKKEKTMKISKNIFIFLSCTTIGCVTEPVKQTLEYPPIVTFDSPETGSEYNFGDEITFSGTVFDDNQSSDTLKIVWNSDKDLILDESPASIDGVVTLTISDLSASTHIITITAIDDKQASAQDWIQIEIDD